MKTQIFIKVGHSAYKGTNALRFCFSKAQAVRVLCNRGMKRAAARAAVKALTAKGSYSTVCVDINYQLCELSDMTEILSAPTLKAQHGFYGTLAEIKAAWKNAPEF